METTALLQDASRRHHSLDMLSRWKGMETRLRRNICAHGALYFGYAFPLEGNGN